MLFPCLLACLSFAQPAQTSISIDSVTTSLYPIHVGLQVTSFRFAGLGQFDDKGSGLAYRMLMPTIGYNFSKRAGVEIGLLRPRQHDGPTTNTTDSNDRQYSYYNQYNSWAIPVLFRYQFLPRARHWGVEGVAGFSFVHNRVNGYRSITEAGQPQQPYELGGFTKANDTPVALGAALTYTPTPHLTLVGEGRLNWSYMSYAVRNLLFDGSGYDVQYGASIGLRYNFGVKR